MQNAWIWIVGIVVIAVGGFIWWQSMQVTPSPAEQMPTIGGTNDYGPPPSDQGVQSWDTSTGASVDAGASVETTPISTTVTYTDSGFSPSSITVAKDGKVTFVNKSTRGMWVASGPHPAHTGYDGTSRTAHCTSGYAGLAPFDQCAEGGSFTFVFTKSGTWPYHNHSSASDFGKVIVQ